MSDTLDDLRRLHVLKGLGDEHLEQLAGIAQQASFPAGVTVFREGEPATEVYLVLEGNVSLEICAAGVGCRRILTVGEGELLGWSPVLEHTLLTATARTLSPVRALKIHGKQILALCEHDTQFGYELMRCVALALAHRLSATRMQLLNVYGEAMPATADERKQ